MNCRSHLGHVQSGRDVIDERCGIALEGNDSLFPLDRRVQLTALGVITSHLQDQVKIVSNIALGRIITLIAGPHWNFSTGMACVAVLQPPAVRIRYRNSVAFGAAQNAEAILTTALVSQANEDERQAMMVQSANRAFELLPGWILRSMCLVPIAV